MDALGLVLLTGADDVWSRSGSPCDVRSLNGWAGDLRSLRGCGGSAAARRGPAEMGLRMAVLGAIRSATLVRGAVVVRIILGLAGCRDAAAGTVRIIVLGGGGSGSSSWSSTGGVMGWKYQYPITHLYMVLLCFVLKQFLSGLMRSNMICPYSSGLLHWQRGNHIRLLLCQWSNRDIGKTNHYQTTSRHKKTQIVCRFLVINCILGLIINLLSLLLIQYCACCWDGVY